jgi:hypothetical protein
MFLLVLTGAVLGGVAALAGLLQFSIVTRCDPLAPDAHGRRAGWARRAAGLHVRRTDRPAEGGRPQGRSPARVGP